MHKHIAVAALLLFAALGPAARADTEALNDPYVKAGPYGQCYAKAVPDEQLGEDGVTRLYEVSAEEDELLATYDWFSQQIYLNCHVMRNGAPGVSVVRFGHWPSGHEANENDLALALYFNGEHLASYSTLDIAGTPDNVDASVSHYMVFSNVIGFRYTKSGDSQEFVVETSDGRTLAFDTATGKLR